MKRWPIQPLGDFIAKKSGSVDPSKFPDEVFDLYSIPAFDSGEPEIRAGKGIGSAKQIVEPGDVLLSRIVPHIRRSWVVGAERGARLIASGEWIVFRSPQLHPDFLRHFLASDPFHAQFMQTVSGVGGSLLRAKVSEVAKIEIPVPTLAEQERIVKLLDEADALRKLRADADTRTAALTPAVFHEMFGDPGTNPKNWPLSPLRENLDVLYRYPTFYGTSYVADGVPVARIGNILSSNTLDPDLRNYVRVPYEFSKEFPRTILKPGDLVMAVRGDTTGKIGFVPPALAGSNISPNLIRLSPNTTRIKSEYLLRLLLFLPSLIEANITDTAKKSITAENLALMRIPVPPVPMQEQFAQRVTEIRELEAAQAASRQRLESLFQSLLHGAFAGEL